MTLDFLTDAEFPVLQRRVGADKVREYVAATDDDATRWTEVAPPSYAGALLFVSAPQLLHHPDVVRYTTVLVHLDQRFAWHRPIALDSRVILTGAVTRVRSRGGSYFVTFQMTATIGDDLAIESTSTFLLGDEAMGEPPEERSEPVVRAMAASDRPQPYDAGLGVPSLAKSVSRLGLVQYASASGDFNPIHFDHQAARDAGLPGIVGHGLLTTAWATQLAAAATSSPLPLSELTVRFRDPMFPSDAVIVAGEAGAPQNGLRRIDITVTAGGRTPVTARAMVREA